MDVEWAAMYVAGGPSSLGNDTAANILGALHRINTAIQYSTSFDPISDSKARWRGCVGQESPFPGLSQLDLTGERGKQEHDGEPCEQSSILYEKGSERASSFFILLTDFIHLREHISQSNVQKHPSS